jgi:hypothetical protein
MAWFKSWLGVRASMPTEIDRVGVVAESFSALTLAGVPVADFHDHPRKQKDAVAFHFGAIDYLAERHAIDDTMVLVLYVRFMQRHPLVATQDLGSVSALMGEIAHDEECRRFAQAGREAVERWSQHADESAPGRLAQLLRRVGG